MNQTQDKTFWKCSKCGFTLTEPKPPESLPGVQGDLRIQECDLLFAGMRRGRQYRSAPLRGRRELTAPPPGLSASRAPEAGAVWEAGAPRGRGKAPCAFPPTP